jgi:hypothetical protein
VILLAVGTAKQNVAMFAGIQSQLREPSLRGYAHPVALDLKK